MRSLKLCDRLLDMITATDGQLGLLDDITPASGSPCSASSSRACTPRASATARPPLEVDIDASAPSFRMAAILSSQALQLCASVWVLAKASATGKQSGFAHTAHRLVAIAAANQMSVLTHQWRPLHTREKFKHILRKQTFR